MNCDHYWSETQHLWRINSNWWVIKTPSQIYSLWMALKTKSRTVDKDTSIRVGILLKVNRIIVLTDLRREVRNLIHSGHQGIGSVLSEQENMSTGLVSQLLKSRTIAAPVLMNATNSQLNQLYLMKFLKYLGRKLAQSSVIPQKNPYDCYWLYIIFFGIHSLTEKQYPTVIMQLKIMFSKISMPQTLLLVTMVLNSKQINSKYLQRIGISNMTVFYIHNPM